jgi:Ca2+-binding RTX toxin-like protein
VGRRFAFSVNNQANTLNGTNAADQIAGGASNDTVNGEGGNDEIFGDSGDDTLNGDAGNDNVQGGTGDNRVNGNDGKDFVSGVDNDINDVVNGGPGNDDTCVVDLINGQTDDATTSCETILEAQQV